MARAIGALLAYLLIYAIYKLFSKDKDENT